MNRRIIRVAVLAAAAMTMSLASPVSAQAQESGAAGFKTASASLSPAASNVAPSAVTPSNAFSSFSVRHGVMFRRGGNQVATNLVPAVAGSNFRADVYVNKRYRGQVKLAYSNFFYYPGVWRAGAVRLGPVRYTDANGVERVVNQYSNYFRIRQGLYSKPGLKQFRMTRKGKKVTLQARSVRTFNGTNWVSTKKAIVQVRKGGKWRKFKTLKLNKAGHSKKYKFSRKGKRTYRLYIPSSTRIAGGATRGIRM